MAGVLYVFVCMFACGLAGLAASSLITILRVCRNMPAMRTRTKKHTLDYIWQVEALAYHINLPRVALSPVAWK